MMQFKEWFERHEEDLVERFIEVEDDYRDFEEFVTSEYESALGDYNDAQYEAYKDYQMNGGNNETR